MANVLGHRFISPKADGADGTQVQPSHWNDGHKFAGGNVGDYLTRDPTDATFGALWQPAGAWTTVTTAAVGTQNNFNPGIVGNTIINCTNATDLTVTGLSPAVPPYNGQRVRLCAKGAGHVLTTQYGASTYCFINGFVGSAAAAGGNTGFTTGYLEYAWSSYTGAWFLTDHVQGAWIRPPFSAARYTATAGAWVVDAGDETTYAYYLMGRVCVLSVYLVTTTVTASPGNLLIALPYTIGPGAVIPVIMAPTGANETGFVLLNAGATTVALQRMAGAFSATTNATNIFFTIPFGIQ